MIAEFQGAFRFLSNFWLADIRNQAGLRFLSVEHAYQFMKFPAHPVLQRNIREAKLASDAKKIASLNKSLIRPDWLQIRLILMEKLIAQKFDRRNPHLVEQLLATGEEYLQEGNRWKDTFWGVDLATGQGENHLGRLIMARREQLKGT